MPSPRNPLAPSVVPAGDPSNPLMQPPTLADAWQRNAQVYSAWADEQRRQGIADGTIDPQTGWPTAKGLAQAGSSYANALLMGTTAPEGAAANALTKGITAYHGSPHHFDTFDLSKIGTGEGAQVYGHGLYFADNEAVAKSYRDALTAEQGQRHYWQDAAGKNVDLDALRSRADADDPMGLAASMLHQSPSVDAAIADTHSYGPSAFPGGQPQMDATLAGLQAMKASGLTRVKDQGAMYQVNIGADPAQFIDWDKPLGAQTPAVQQAMLGVRFGGDAGQIKAAQASPDYMGRSVQSMMMDLSHPKVAGGPAEASQALSAAGIPGIRYLDGGSRADGSGTSNTVVFDPATIAIIRKYGLAGLIGGGGAAAAASDPSQGDPSQSQ